MQLWELLKVSIWLLLLHLGLEPEVSKAGGEDRDKWEVGAEKTGACKDGLESTLVSLCPQVSTFDDGVGSAGEIGRSPHGAEILYPVLESVKLEVWAQLLSPHSHTCQQSSDISLLCPVLTFECNNNLALFHLHFPISHCCLL